MQYSDKNKNNFIPVFVFRLSIRGYNFFTYIVEDSKIMFEIIKRKRFPHHSTTNINHHLNMLYVIRVIENSI